MATIPQTLGNIFDIAGGALGLPEFGISERLAGEPTVGSTVVGSPTPVSSTPVIPSSGFSTGGGQVLGTTTGGTAPTQNLNVPLESTAGVEGQTGDMFNEIDAALGQAQSALDQFAATLGPASETARKEVEAGAEQRIGETRSEEASRVEEFGRQRETEKGRTESAIEEARRQTSELQRGIQARFGGTTGTGAFASGVLGSQALRNISQNRVALQNTLGQIGAAENKVKDTATRLVNQVKSDTELAKERIRNELQQNLADIASRKGELASRKAELRLGVLQNAQGLIAGINQRNTQMQQEIFLKAQNASSQINEFKATTMQQFNAMLEGFQPRIFNVGGTQVGAFPTSSGGLQFIKGTTDDSLANPFEEEEKEE